MPSASFRTLDVIVIGAGLSGISTAIALRRQGHRVRMFDKRDVASEVGNSISLAKNGGQWVAEWGVDIQKGEWGKNERRQYAEKSQHELMSLRVDDCSAQASQSTCNN